MGAGLSSKKLPDVFLVSKIHDEPRCFTGILQMTNAALDFKSGDEWVWPHYLQRTETYFGFCYVDNYEVAAKHC